MRCLMFLFGCETAAMDSLSSVNSQSHACACVRKVRRGDSQGVRVAPEVLLVPANRGAPKGNKEEKMRLRVISHLRGNCWIIKHVLLNQVPITPLEANPTSQNVLEDNLQSQWEEAQTTSSFLFYYTFPKAVPIKHCFEYLWLSLTAAVT